MGRRGIMKRSRYLGITLMFFALDFVVLGGLSYHATHSDAPLNDVTLIVIAALMGIVGFGFGTFLVLFPNSVSDAYGNEKFGVYLSYIQIGAGIAAVTVPAATS